MSTHCIWTSAKMPCCTQTFSTLTPTSPASCCPKCFCLHVFERHSIHTFTRQTVTASDTTVKQLQHTHHRRLRHEKKDDTPENKYGQQTHGERSTLSVYILTSPWLRDQPTFKTVWQWVGRCATRCVPPAGLNLGEHVQTTTHVQCVPPNCNCSSPPRNKQSPGAPPSCGRRCFFHPQLRSFAALVVPDDTAILRERGCFLRVTKFGHSHKKPCFRPQSAMIIKRVCRPWVTARKAVLPRFDVVSPMGVVLRALASCSSKHREEVLEAAFSFMTFSPAPESMVSSRNWSTDTVLIWASFCLSQPR